MTRTSTANGRKGTANGQSTAGMLLSLASALPSPDGPLARNARRIAHRLSDGRASAHDHDLAALVLTQLLDATDTGLALDDEGLLDAGFDG